MNGKIPEELDDDQWAAFVELVAMITDPSFGEALVAQAEPFWQRARGFAMQSLMIGLGAVIASSLPWLLTNFFHIGGAATAAHTILGSLGGALAVAAHAGGAAGALLAYTARAAFMNGTGMALTVGAAVALGGAVLVIARLPSRVPRDLPDASVSVPAKQRSAKSLQSTVKRASTSKASCPGAG